MSPQMTSAGEASLKENYKINFTTFNAGTFIIDKDTKSVVWKDDEAKGVRYYTIDLKKLISPNSDNKTISHLQ